MNVALLVERPALVHSSETFSFLRTGSDAFKRDAYVKVEVNNNTKYSAAKAGDYTARKRAREHAGVALWPTQKIANYNLFACGKITLVFFALSEFFVCFVLSAHASYLEARYRGVRRIQRSAESLDLAALFTQAFVALVKFVLKLPFSFSELSCCEEKNERC